MAGEDRMINDYADIPAFQPANQNSPGKQLLERSKVAVALAMITTLFDLIDTMPEHDQLFILEELTSEQEHIIRGYQ